MLFLLLVKEMDFEQTLLNFKDINERLKYTATLPEKLVIDLCAKNTELNNTVCLNEDYWKIRYLRKNKLPTIEPKSWKELYLFSSKNDVWSFGDNVYGELGLGDTTNRNVPTKIPPVDCEAKYIACGENHSLIIDMNDNVWLFGKNYSGQLGLGDTTDRLVPTKIPSVEGWNGKAKYIACGENHSILIDINDNVWSFGNNVKVQLGLGDTTDRNIPTNIHSVEGWNGKAKYIACGEYHSIIIDTNDNVWSFGNNNKGQLGLGDTNNRPVPNKIPSVEGWNGKAKYIECGGNHSIIIDMNDNVWSFGNNYSGQLGLGDTNNRLVPTKISSVEGWTLKEKAKQIASGRSSSLIIDMNDNVWSFGNNQSGQLGLDDIENRNKPTQILNIKAKQIACGREHSMIIDTDSNTLSFGNNYSGQLGLGDKADRNKPTQIPGIKAKQIACGGEHSMMLTSIEPLLPLDEITNMFSQGQIVKFEIEHNLQIPHKALQGIYVVTFTDKEGQKKYGYIRYNQETNQILKP